MFNVDPCPADLKCSLYVRITCAHDVRQTSRCLAVGGKCWHLHRPAEASRAMAMGMYYDIASVKLVNMLHLFARQ